MALNSSPRLVHPLVRDLATMMGAPGLLRPRMGPTAPEILDDRQCQLELSRRLDIIRALDRNPQGLENAIAAPAVTPRIGRYFESLLGYWIREFIGVNRFASNLPVRRGKITVGEFDFVFETLTGETLHWEVAVKFYLCIAQTPEAAKDAASYVGTQTRDRLDLKMNKILGPQLRLGDLPEARETLLQAGFDSPLRSQALVKGALFYPVESDWRNHPYPDEVSAEHSRGWWSHGFPFGRAHASMWAILEKPHWHAPFFAPVAPDFQPMSREVMADFCARHFAVTRTALMIAEVQREGDAWVERERGMLVNEGWPRITKSQESEEEAPKRLANLVSR